VVELKAQVDEFKRLLGDSLYLFDTEAMLPSEVFFIWRAALAIGVDRIVESGTYKGKTAKRLSLALPKCQIVTFERKVKRQHKNAKRYRDTDIVFIDTSLDAAWVTSKTGVVIDGPKGQVALDLAESLVDQAAFVMVHDLRGELVESARSMFSTVIPSSPDVLLRELDKLAGWKNVVRDGVYGGPMTLLSGRR
jgi:hypothetical protein